MTAPHLAEVVDDEMAEVLRQKTPAQRLQIAFGMWQFVRNTLRRQLASANPAWTEEEVCHEVARRMLHDT
ncbi:hypothetical protein [Anatilimnocola floriformis]|uniref:hypothetical protein n=1 Tax=Anatilimnocola floriformis TaxID=2948575 RepID=UPI0020C38A29|nr:hypothetical protein [Anatilimnocola floriformis]